ncbi:putative lipoprotein [Anoxybacillus amylolyticus]|uniref:Putative lipoprotein n=1 Tax=Anoxybacteroides amylolyticum TaxID=294699 RepID=A0A160F135_9BACL|nr:putative lipoprotein [Anoxybacillus amylolyticus]
MKTFKLAIFVLFLFIVVGCSGEQTNPKEQGTKLMNEYKKNAGKGYKYFKGKQKC